MKVLRERPAVVSEAVAIAGLVVLEAWALFLGYDGAVLAAVLMVLAGLGGYRRGQRSQRSDRR